MKTEEILEKAQKKKTLVSEFEKAKINKSNWIAVICTCVVAIAFIVVEAILGRKAVCFAIGAICFTWASVFYFCQYFIAKRPWGVLLGAIFDLIGALIMVANYILTNCGVI